MQTFASFATFYFILHVVTAQNPEWFIFPVLIYQVVRRKRLLNKCCCCILIGCAVSGFGFGVISGAFSLVNVLADMTGPGTVGILGNSSHFFITSGTDYVHLLCRVSLWSNCFILFAVESTELSLTVYIIGCWFLP